MFKIGTFVLSIAFALYAQGEEIPSVQIHSLLESSQENFNIRPPISFDFSTDYSLIGGPESDLASFKERRQGGVDYDGNRLITELIDDRWDKTSNDYKVARIEQRFWDNNRSIGLRTFLNNGRQNEHGFTTKVKLHDGIRPDMTGWFLDGVVIDSDHFSMLMLESPDIKGYLENKGAENELIRIDGTTPKGPMSVWFTQSEPPLLQRIQFEGNNSFLDELGDLKAVNFDMTIDEYSEVDGVLVPIKGTAVYTYHNKDDSLPVVKQFKTQRENILINPDFESMGTFNFELEEGTVVKDYDVPENRYVWKEGKLLPYISLEMEQSLDIFNKRIVKGLLDDPQVSITKLNPEESESPSTLSDKIVPEPEQSHWGKYLAFLVLASIIILVRRRYAKK